MSDAVTVGLVIVSHSEKLAEGVVELTEQMARDVPLRAAAGAYSRPVREELTL